MNTHSTAVNPPLPCAAALALLCALAWPAAVLHAQTAWQGATGGRHGQFQRSIQPSASRAQITYQRGARDVLYLRDFGELKPSERLQLDGTGLARILLRHLVHPGLR